jgi:hypothetical protein
MALQKVGLGFPVVVENNTTTAVYSVASNTKSYIRGILVHSQATVNSVVVDIHVVQNSAGSLGTVTASNRVAKLSLQPLDTYFFELPFPIVISATNDAIFVKNNAGSGDTADDLTVLVLGDKEA